MLFFWGAPSRFPHFLLSSGWPLIGAGCNILRSQRFSASSFSPMFSACQPLIDAWVNCMDGWMDGEENVLGWKGRWGRSRLLKISSGAFPSVINLKQMCTAYFPGPQHATFTLRHLFEVIPRSMADGCAKFWLVYLHSNHGAHCHRTVTAFAEVSVLYYTPLVESVPVWLLQAHLHHLSEQNCSEDLTCSCISLLFQR